MRRIADFYPGKAKTDAKGAFIIADTARAMPRTLRAIDGEDETIAELETIVGFDDDLAGEATRVANRLHGLLTQRHGQHPLRRLAAAHPALRLQRRPRDCQLASVPAHAGHTHGERGRIRPHHPRDPGPYLLGGGSRPAPSPRPVADAVPRNARW